MTIDTVKAIILKGAILLNLVILYNIIIFDYIQTDINLDNFVVIKNKKYTSK